MNDEELQTDKWHDTDYICKDCGGEDVVSNITNDWKLFYCNDCGSQTPLAVEDIIKEATR